VGLGEMVEGLGVLDVGRAEGLGCGGLGEEEEAEGQGVLG